MPVSIHKTGPLFWFKFVRFLFVMCFVPLSPQISTFIEIKDVNQRIMDLACWSSLQSEFNWQVQTISTRGHYVMTDSSKISPIYCLSFYIRSSQRLHTVTWAPLFPSHRHDALVSPPYSRRCAVCSFPYLSSMLCPTLPRPSVFSPPPPSLHASPSLVATSSSPARSLLKSNNYTINWPSLHQSLFTPWTFFRSLRLTSTSCLRCILSISSQSKPVWCRLIPIPTHPAPPRPRVSSVQSHLPSPSLHSALPLTPSPPRRVFACSFSLFPRHNSCHDTQLSPVFIIN